MSNPQTFYIVGTLDLSGIFQPYTSGNNAVTGYKISTGQDLSGIFQPYISGNKASVTNYFVNNGNYFNLDLSDIFAPYNPNSITPIGGTVNTSGIYTIVSFLTTGSSGSINISSTGSNTFYYLVVGGGGPGGADFGGGGGAGGVLQGTFSITGSDTINVTVGAGGIITYSSSTQNGEDSTLSYTSTTITAKGGGYGGWSSGWGTPKNQPGNGGCGGGCGSNITIAGTGTQGKNGGVSIIFGGGAGGGGMDTDGTNGIQYISGNGGNGIQSTQPGINLIYPSTYWGGGGGGGLGQTPSIAGNGGLGGGGGGASSDTGGINPGTQGTGGSGLNSGQNGTATSGGNGGTNTGGGGGGGPQLNPGGNGGSGIIVIAYLTP